jgi:hypothetical protein
MGLRATLTVDFDKRKVSSFHNDRIDVRDSADTDLPAIMRVIMSRSLINAAAEPPRTT